VKGSKLVTIQYAFNDPVELRDWKPDAASEDFRGWSKQRHLGALVEMTGRVAWRGAIKGEAALEVAVAGGGSGMLSSVLATNANFVLYDRGRPWDGWLCGIGTRPFGMDKFNVQRPGQKPVLTEFPCHVVARCRGGSQAQAEFLFGSHGPFVPPGNFKVAVTVKKRQLTMYLGIGSGQLKQLTAHPIADAEMQGGLAVETWSDTITIDEITLRGEIDEAWLKTEALERARAELAPAVTAKDGK
jgi:hypothetical protein